MADTARDRVEWFLKALRREEQEAGEGGGQSVILARSVGESLLVSDLWELLGQAEYGVRLKATAVQAMKKAEEAATAAEEAVTLLEAETMPRHTRRAAPAAVQPAVQRAPSGPFDPCPECGGVVSSVSHELGRSPVPLADPCGHAVLVTVVGGGLGRRYRLEKP